LNAFERFLLSNFYRKKTFSNIQNYEFFQDGVIFKKKRLLQVFTTLNSTFFKFSKSNSVAQRPKINKKKTKENFQIWRMFSTWRDTLRLHFFREHLKKLTLLKSICRPSVCPSLCLCAISRPV
jgi:hypothetical protein